MKTQKSDELTAEKISALLAGIAPDDALRILKNAAENLNQPLENATNYAEKPDFTIIPDIQITRTSENKKNDKQHTHDLTPAKDHKNTGIEPMLMTTITTLDRLTPLQKTALDVLKWCRAVARIEPDSPRLCYYASRWHVLDKIARSKAAGTFSLDTAGCAPIDLEHLQAGIAAVQECHSYSALYSGHVPKPGTPKAAKTTKARQIKAGECCHTTAPAGQSDKFIA